jgi:two-component system, NtrC family, sensor kinase
LRELRLTEPWHINCFADSGLTCRWTSIAMNSFPVPFKIVLTILLTALVVVVGVLNVRDRIAWTDPTDGIFWKETGSGLRASDVEGPGLQAGIKPGDRLVSIDGRLIPNLESYSDILYGLGPNADAKYVVTSDAGQRTAMLELAAKRLLSPKDVLLVILAFLHLGIGLFVVFRGSGLPQSVHFYLICVAAFVAYLYSFTPKLDGLDWIVYLMSVLAFLLLAPLFVHFCLRFPVDSPKGQTLSPLLYAPAALLGLIQMLWLSGRLARFGLPRDTHSFELLDRAFMIYLSLGFIVGGVLLLKRRSQVDDLLKKQQMKWVSYGTLAGILPFAVIYEIPVLAGLRPNLATESSVLSLGLIPLLFAYAIVRYRLLDVEVIVRRGAAYFLTSSTLLALYLFFVLIIGRALQVIAPGADFTIIAMAALAIALLFAPLRNGIQMRLDRFFYKERFDDRSSLLEFARTLSTEISLERLSRTILERVSKTFQMEKVALFLADPHYPGFYRLTDSEGIGIDEEAHYREEDLIDENRSVKVLDLQSGNRLRRAHASLVLLGLQYLQELKLRGRRIGMIAFGELPRDAHFSTEDLDLLTALAGYAAIALENANLYRSIEMKAIELERLKIYTENIIESVNVAIVALDLGGRITSCNRAFEHLYGTRRHQITGASIETILSADVVTSIHKATGTDSWELKSVSNIFKMYVRERAEEKLIVNLSLIPLIDSMDITSGCLIVMDDVSERVRLEDQLMQAEKLSSIGLLAAGVAHEVNTPITGISSYTQMLLKQTAADDARKPILEKIERQTFRAAEIVNGLLNFARVNGSEYRDLDLNDLIGESVSLLDHQMRQSHIQLEATLSPLIPAVYGNRGKLQQVFVNLFLNARDAMPSGGTLKIETSKNETMVVVDIADTGVGISPEDIKRIYDPFFTTKGTGKGTGLGLAVTYGIVQEHGGRIFVDSTPNTGTHFRLKLPTRQSLQHHEQQQ